MPKPLGVKEAQEPGNPPKSVALQKSMPPW